MPKSVWTSGADPNALFKSGQVVAYYSGVWQVADFADSITNFEWVSAPTPAQPVHATDINLGGKVVAFNNVEDRRGGQAVGRLPLPAGQLHQAGLGPTATCRSSPGSR